MTMMRGLEKELANSLLRGQFQGLPFPPGVLSDARHPGLVQPRDGPQAGLAGRRRSALRANRRRLESGRQVPGLCPGGGEGRLYRKARSWPSTPTTRTRRQIQYDLYRIPFNDGKGGQPEPIAGASRNGMSNSFPKVSPDGRWIVFVKCRNGQLMRPDSQLYIVPVGRRRGAAHAMQYSADELLAQLLAQRPLAGVLLEEPLALHADVPDAHGREGNDSPAILIENATAANRAVNIPEFVNIPPDGMMKIDVPAAESYRLFDIALDLTAKGQLDAGIAEWKKVLELDPRNAKAHNNLGAALVAARKPRRGDAALSEGSGDRSRLSEAQSNLGISFVAGSKGRRSDPPPPEGAGAQSCEREIFDAILSSPESPAPPPPTGLRLEDALVPIEAGRDSRECPPTEA